MYIESRPMLMNALNIWIGLLTLYFVYKSASRPQRCSPKYIKMGYSQSFGIH